LIYRIVATHLEKILPGLRLRAAEPPGPGVRGVALYYPGIDGNPWPWINRFREGEEARKSRRCRHLARLVYT